MSKFKRKKISNKAKYNGDPKNGFWSRMTHKWWVREYFDKKNKNARVEELVYSLV